MHCRVCYLFDFDIKICSGRCVKPRVAVLTHLLFFMALGDGSNNSKKNCNLSFSLSLFNVRSWVGANSGTITQRQVVMYENREDSTTFYRVHPTPGIMLYSNFKVKVTKIHI